jgi:hypothetical protein
MKSNYAEVKCYNTAGIMLRHTFPTTPDGIKKELLYLRDKRQKGHDVIRIEIYRFGVLDRTINMAAAPAGKINQEG